MSETKVDYKSNGIVAGKIIVQPVLVKAGTYYPGQLLSRNTASDALEAWVDQDADVGLIRGVVYESGESVLGADAKILVAFGEINGSMMVDGSNSSVPITDAISNNARENGQIYFQ